jgi:hypothetical protein
VHQDNSCAALILPSSLLPLFLRRFLELLRSCLAAAAAFMQAREKHDLSDFATRAPALIKQLQGLTVVCSQPSEQYDEWAAPYRPMPLLTALTSLTSEHPLCSCALATVSATIVASVPVCAALSLVLRFAWCMCSQPSEQYDEWAAPYWPVPLLTALTSLTCERLLCMLALVAPFFDTCLQ